MPWSGAEPHPLLTGWTEDRGLTGGGRREFIVGCGLGADAEYLPRLGFDTAGFDISETAIQLARQRNPGSMVGTSRPTCLIPQRWWRAHDPVVEIITVQALPDLPRRQAITNVSRMVAPGCLALMGGRLFCS